LRADRVLATPVVAEALGKANGLGWSLASALTVVLFLWAGFNIILGGGRDDGLGGGGGITRSMVWGIAACTFVLATTVPGSRFRAAAPDSLARQLGAGLGKTFAVAENPFAEFWDAVGKIMEGTLALQKTLAFVSGSQTDRPAGPDDPATLAVAHWTASPLGASLMVANAIAVWAMGILLQCVHAWLVTFYTLLEPLVGACLILPHTRRMFYGWARAYLSLCLWPMMFALAERMVGAIKWGAFLGVGDLAASPQNAPALVAILGGATVSLLITNFLFFFVYLSVPVMSYMLVAGAGRPFRGAV
jgi:hypothetical protein